MLLEWSSYPSKQHRQQTVFYDMHRRATFPSSSLDRVVLFTEATIKHTETGTRSLQSTLYYNIEDLPLRYRCTAVARTYSRASIYFIKLINVPIYNIFLSLMCFEQ